MSTLLRAESKGLQRQGAADQIAAILQDRVLYGEAQPGDSFKEVELAAEFNVARNTVREALRLLTREGLATHQVHRGVTVREFTVQEVRDIYGARKLLQAEAGKRAGTLTPEEISTLAAEVELGRAALSRGDARDWLTHNMKFHQETVALLGNPRLDTIFVGLLREIRLVLTGFEREPSDVWDRGNQRLLELLIQSDESAYRAAVSEYLDDSCNDAVRQMRESTR
jgi:DNA-binding GntR family transcriptional regulator